MSEIFIYDLTDTWNNSGNVFDAIKMNVTNTASASGSKLLNLQVGGVERFTVDVDGMAAAATPTSGDNSTKLATTAFVQGELADYASTASPVFTGTPTAPTATAGTDTSQIATTAFVQGELANLSSTFAGLDDVSLTNLQANDLIQWNGSLFVNVSDINISGDITTSGVYTSGDGTEGAAAYAHGGTGYGMFFKSGRPAFSHSAGIIAAFNAGTLAFGSNKSITWTNGDPVNNSTDLALERDSAAVLKVTDGSTGYGKIVADGYQLNNPINSQTGTTYTATVADAERYVQLDNAAAITVTVPSDTTANLPIGSTVTFEQTGAGTVTFAADSGVTINSRGAVLSTAGQFAVASIIKTASNTFTLTGDLV